MTVLVTGAGGFLGAAVAARCREVVAVHHGATYAFEGETARLDLASAAHVAQLIDDLGMVSAGVHCAAVTRFNRAGSFDDGPNRRMTDNVIALCEATGVDRLIFVSGWVVYAADSAPVAEGDPLEPATPYGASKLRAERAFHARLPKTRLVCARLSSVYGRGQRSPGLIPNLVTAGLAGQPLRIAAPETRRDYLHIADAAAAVRRLLELELDEHLDINVGSGTSVAVSEVARLVRDALREELGRTPALECDPHAAGTGPPDNRLDVALARRRGVIGAPLDLAAGLRDYVAWRAEAERQRAR